MSVLHLYRGEIKHKTGLTRGRIKKVDSSLLSRGDQTEYIVIKAAVPPDEVGKGAKIKKDKHKFSRLIHDILIVLSKKPSLKGKLDRLRVFRILERGIH